MAIRRGALPADHFTIISNAWMRDARLSWKAKGLLAYVAGHAPGHELTTEQIAGQGKDGLDAIRAGLAELEQAGYLTRRRKRDDNGRVTGIDYELSDPEQGQARPGKPLPGAEQPEQDVSAGQSTTGKSRPGKSDPKKTTSPEDQKKTPSTSSRGARLPMDWIPSEELVAWTKENAPGVGWVEVEKFRDYWHSMPGQRGVRLDWDATWRNWARRAAETTPAPARSNHAGRRTAGQDQAARTDLIQRATDSVVAAGGSAEDTAAVLAELTRLELLESDATGNLALSTVDTCRSMPYIEGQLIDTTGTGGDPQ